MACAVFWFQNAKCNKLCFKITLSQKWHFFGNRIENGNFKKDESANYLELPSCLIGLLGFSQGSQTLVIERYPKDQNTGITLIGGVESLTEDHSVIVLGDSDHFPL